MGNNFTPAWIKKGFFNESLFCDDFLSTHQPVSYTHLTLPTKA